VLLKELGLPVYGLHDTERQSWDTDGMPEALERFTVGDCRRHSALERAGVTSCRAVLFTTGDDRTNISGALAARSLDPHIRLVIRSSHTNLNERLNQSLGDAAALDIAELPATAFALAAIDDEILGLLSLEGQLLRVVERRLGKKDGWIVGRRLRDLNTRWRHVLLHSGAGTRGPIDFHAWDPDQIVHQGDTLAYVEFHQPEPARAAEPPAAGESKRWTTALRWTSIRSRLDRLWTESTPTHRVVALVAGALLVLHATGVLLYKLQYPETSLLDAFNVATVLIFDGYSNMFAQLKLPFPISLWMLLFSLMLTMSGALVMGMLYAFLTARVLSARLEFRRRPARVPRGKHAIVIGTGPLGRRVAHQLADLEQAVVAVGQKELPAGVLQGIPLIAGEPRQCLAKANAKAAASILAITDDDVTNFELALMSAQLNENCRIVIRADDSEFGHNVNALAPRTEALSVYELAAEAFAAIALGERVLNLLRIGGETVLTTEFMVQPGDTLEGRLLAEVTCGYGLVAILYQRCSSDKPEFFPPQDLRLHAGDRLVVLATMGGLQNAEHGSSAERTHEVRILSVLPGDSEFEAARAISRLTGFGIGAASSLLGSIPATVPRRLFLQQAQQLRVELELAGVDAEVLPVNTDRAGASTTSSDR
jgi:Trk K+ transport system NAD-binding subunit